MRYFVISMLAVCALSGCHVSPRPAVAPASETDLAAAEAIVDAFYSFDSAKLTAALANAPESVPVIAFYQGWAEGGHYRVLERAPCRAETATEVSCSITVKDDLIGALGLPMNVTDTFHITFSNGKAVRVRTSSNDPALFEEALQWVKRERPAVLDGPCRGFFAGGPTPGDCVRAVVAGFREFAELRRRQ